MIVRSIDGTGDWTFGAGLNNYKSANLAVVQCIQTRLSSFIGNCFFDMGAGINWFGFLSGKDTLGLRLALAANIMNTPNVVNASTTNKAILGLLTLTFNLTAQRSFSITYQVQSIYSVTGGTFSYDLGGSF